jgi:hypothetical protein
MLKNTYKGFDRKEKVLSSKIAADFFISDDEKTVSGKEVSRIAQIMHEFIKTERRE